MCRAWKSVEMVEIVDHGMDTMWSVDNEECVDDVETVETVETV